MSERIDIGAGGLVTDTLGHKLGNVTVTRGLLYVEHGGRRVIETDTLRGLRFSLSTMYNVPEANIRFDSWWHITEKEAKP